MAEPRVDEAKDQPPPDAMAIIQAQINANHRLQQQQIHTIMQAIQRLQNPQEQPPPPFQNIPGQPPLDIPPFQDQPRPLCDFYNPSTIRVEPHLRIPEGGDDFELKLNVLSLIQSHFHGSSNEDPFQHLEDLDRIAQTVKLSNISLDIVLIKMFPFSLRDKAYHWLRTLGRPITT